MKGSWLTLGLLLGSMPLHAEVDLKAVSGLDLMKAVYERHQQYPFVYEEQSMVLIDGEGNRETRKVKMYSRVEPDLLQRILLLFDSPEDVKGVAILAQRDSEGNTKQAIYLPALGPQMMENSGEVGDASFLGTDFSVENLTGERLSDYDYVRQRDAMINDKMYCLVDVFNKGASKDMPLRRHFIAQENLYLTRTDYFDDLGRVRKRQSYHDLTPVLGEMWRANMILMENLSSDHQTLIKIDRRVFSKDYVPSEVFTKDFLYSYSQPAEVEDVPDIEAEARLLGEPVQ